MNKIAHVAEESMNDAIQEAIQDAKMDSDKNYLKKRMEDEIRMKLDQFARELSQVKQQRDAH